MWCYNNKRRFTLNSNKFTIDSSNGNTLVAGTLAVSGTSLFSSTLTVGEDDTGHDVKFFGAHLVRICYGMNLR